MFDYRKLVSFAILSPIFAVPGAAFPLSIRSCTLKTMKLRIMFWQKSMRLVLGFVRDDKSSVCRKQCSRNSANLPEMEGFVVFFWG